MPPKKRTKTASNTCRAGKTLTVFKGLERLPNMPLDLLLEIFGLLHPRDLLSLARTSKAFRAFLMRRAAASLWEKARKQVDGLPDLPAHLSEPQYANLVFFEHCHECLQTENVTAYWRACARYCNECVQGFPYRADCHALNDIYTEFEEVESCKVVNLIGYVKIHPQALEEIERAWYRLRTKADKEKFVNERMAFVAECEEFEDAMEEWEEMVEAEKEEQRAALRREKRREKRMHAIMDSLRDEGWGMELDAMSEGSMRNLKDLKGVSVLGDERALKSWLEDS